MKASILALCATLLALPCPATPTDPESPPALALAQDNPFPLPLTAAATPAPPPAPNVIVVQAPQNPESKVAGWVAFAIFVVGGIATVAGFAIKKYVELLPAIAELKATQAELKSRQDRQASKTGSLQEQVTANARAITPATASSPAPPAGSTIGVPLVALLLAATAIFTAGCATNTPDAARNAQNAGINAAGSVALREAGKVLGRAAVSALFSVAQTELTGGKADFGQAAAQGLWSQAQTGITSDTIFSITSAFSAGKAKQTAAEAAAAASVAIDSGKPPAKVAAAIASVISTASGAPPAK